MLEKLTAARVDLTRKQEQQAHKSTAAEKAKGVHKAAEEAEEEANTKEEAANPTVVAAAGDFISLQVMPRRIGRRRRRRTKT